MVRNENIKPAPKIGKVVLQLLLFFLTAGKSAAGADIIRSIGISSGALYPALRRLEKAGWLISQWEEEEDPSVLGRPRRRLYALTEVGRLHAIEQANKHDIEQGKDGRGQKIKVWPGRPSTAGAWAMAGMLITAATASLLASSSVVKMMT